MYRSIVIGRGLIGSAAARHLSELGDGIALFAPPDDAEAWCKALLEATASPDDRGKRAAMGLQRTAPPIPACSPATTTRAG